MNPNLYFRVSVKSTAAFLMRSFEWTSRLRCGNIAGSTEFLENAYIRLRVVSVAYTVVFDAEESREKKMATRLGERGTTRIVHAHIDILSKSLLFLNTIFMSCTYLLLCSVLDVSLIAAVKSILMLELSHFRFRTVRYQIVIQ